MENASKALLIAGAVLLVIALIAVAMGIFGTARGVVDQAEGQIDNMSVQMHNRQFEPYNKSTLTAKEAKDLIAIVISNNKNVTTKDFIVELYVYMIHKITILNIIHLELLG